MKSGQGRWSECASVRFPSLTAIHSIATKPTPDDSFSARQSAADALEDVRAALDSGRPISLETHSAAVELARGHGFKFYDALIVSPALEAGCDQLLTDDMQAGRRLEDMAIVNPFSG